MRPRTLAVIAVLCAAPRVAFAQTPTRERSRPRPARPNPVTPTPSSDAPPSDGELTVRTTRAPAAAATTMSFRGPEMTEAPGTGGDPTRVIGSQPGVARSPYGIGFFAVRGTSLENTGFLLDGFPILNLYHFAGGPSVLPPTLIGSLDFYPGGYPIEYGRYTGGVVAVQTRAPSTDRLRGYGELSIFFAGAGLSTPIDHGRGNITIGIRRSYYDPVLALVAPGVVLSMGDAHIRYEHQIRDRVRVSTLLFGSMDTYDRRAQRNVDGQTSANRDGVVYNFARAIARIDVRGPAGLTAFLSGMIGYDEAGYTAGDTGRPDTRIHYAGLTTGMRSQVRFALSRFVTATAGVDALAYLYDVDLSYPVPLGLNVVPPPQANRYAATTVSPISQTSIAPYADVTLRTDRVEFSTGLRVDALYSNGHRWALVEPRAVIKLRASDTVTVIAASGLFHQPAFFYALVPLIGNPDLPPQRSWQSSVGVEARLPWAFSGRITGYYSRLDQLPRPSQDLVENPDGSVRGVGLLPDGEGRAYGVEFQLRRRLEHGISGWLSYTLARSERWVGNGPVVPSAFDQTHVLAIAASWEINERWRVGARFSLSTGYPTSAVNGAIYDADANAYRADITPEGDRLPLFHQLDLRADYRFRVGPARMTAYLDLLNAYYARATEGWNYRYDFSRQTPVAGLPILPVLGLKGEL